MDQIKTGQFIAEVRKEKSLTQKQLADTLGISDRTISKWENGRGFPDVSLLLPLCEALSISVNELLSGERISAEDYKEKAEENLMTALESSSFSVKERVEYFKRKWLKDHIALIILAILLWIATVIGISMLFRNITLSAIFGGCFSVVLYLISYNGMMAYVEKNAYDGKGNKQE